MNPTQQAKIARFLDDTVMSDSVYEVVRDVFMEYNPTRTSDIHTLAASRIALDMLREAWKELEKFRPKAADEAKDSLNVGI